MRSLAYDEVEGCVPTHMLTLTYDEREVKKLCDFKWAELDLLNHIVLLLRGAQAGTTYAHHPLTKVYHDGDIVRLIQSAGGKLFDSIGFPMPILPEEYRRGQAPPSRGQRVRRPHQRSAHSSSGRREGCLAQPPLMARMAGVSTPHVRRL